MISNLDVIILAAGQGKRMHSSIPKVLHRLAGKPLLQHILDAISKLNAQHTYVVYGKDGDQVKNYFSNFPVTWVNQVEQLGTGHAVQQVLPFLKEENTHVLVLFGDVPLISSKTLWRLLNQTSEEEIGWLTAIVDRPETLGRIVRDKKGDPVAIIEEKDATDRQKEINEINTGICLIPVKYLKQWIPQLNNQNGQGEFYLTDLFEKALKAGVKVNTVLSEDKVEILGINNKAQLAYLERIYQTRKAEEYMQKGLTLLDPVRFDVRGELIFEEDVVIDVNVIIKGRVVVGANSRIGPNTILDNVMIGRGVEIQANCVIEEAEIADDCVVGPFARIRPETKLLKKAKVGNFVEIKKSIIGEGSKVNHLSYIGDSVLGSKVNIGAGTITCNYDGVNKFKTIIEDGAFIGSNTALVAPVKIECGATVGAGSVITQNAPKGKLTLARSKQVTIPHWIRPEKSVDK